MSECKANCLSLLMAIAELTRFELSDVLLTIYLEKLEPVGWKNVQRGLTALLEDVSRFPSIKDIKQAAGCAEALTDDDHAREIPDRMWFSIERYGYTNPERAREHIGPVGWKFVEGIGGWRSLCDSIQSVDAQTTLKAQWRESLKVILKRERLSAALENKGNSGVAAFLGESGNAGMPKALNTAQSAKNAVSQVCPKADAPLFRKSG